MADSIICVSKYLKNAYDMECNFLDFCDSSPNDRNVNISRPLRLNDMIQISKTLFRNMTFIMVDLYSIYDKIYWGELTLYSGSGFIQFNSLKTDYELGGLLILPVIG